MTINYMNNNILLVILFFLLIFFLFKNGNNEEFKLAKTGWTPNLYNKGKKISTHKDKTREECIKLCHNNNLCKSFNYNDNEKKCILTDSRCTKNNCNVSKEWTHWMKPYTDVNADPDYLKICNDAREYWWFPRWSHKKVGKFSNDKDCKSKCDKNLECDAWVAEENGNCHIGKLMDKNLRVSCGRPGWGKWYGQVKSNIKALNVFNERSGEKFKFTGREAGDALRVCTSANLKQKKPADEILSLNSPCLPGECSKVFGKEWKEKCHIPEKTKWTCCAKYNPEEKKEREEPPKPTQIDPLELLPEPEQEPTKAIGILNKISSHLASLKPDFKRGEEDIPVKLNLDVDSTPFLDGLEENINVQASKEGFFNMHKKTFKASKIPYFYREGLTKLQPESAALVHLENINKYLVNQNFPITEETETEVLIKLENNTDKGRKKVKEAMIKKIEEAAGIILKKKRAKKRAQQRDKKREVEIKNDDEGMQPMNLRPRTTMEVDFDSMYDDFYD